MRGIVKRFPGVLALDGVDLEVRAGEVHCLLGQNGAGKSTLIKVLSASYQPDEGEILWDGERGGRCPRRRPRCGSASPRSTRSSTWSPSLSVAENIFLGHELADGGLQPARPRRTGAARELLSRLGHPEISRDPVGRAAVAGRAADRQHGAGPLAATPGC